MFNDMISSALIGAFWVFGAITITIIGIISMFSGGTVEFFIGGAIILAGNVLFRIMCESMIILFSIHDELVKVNQLLREAPAASPADGLTPVPSFSREPVSPASRSPQKTAQPRTSAAPTRHNEWVCDNCGARNMIMAKSCGACGNDKPS